MNPRASGMRPSRWSSDQCLGTR